MFDWLFTVEGWMSLLTLTILEIVLGIDNLVFLSIASQKLPPHQRPIAQKIGLLGALGLRIIMLALLVWITKLDLSGLLDRQPRILLARHHPDRRRPVPAL